MKPLDILITTYHRKQFTYMALESIYTRTRTPIRLVVVDNGSPQDMQDMLREYQRRGIISVLCLLDRNYGLEYAKNTGLRFIESEPYFVNTDNDLLIEAPSNGSDWLQKMIKLMDEHPEFGAVAARPQVLYGVPDIFRDEEKAKHLTDDGQIGFFYGGEGPCGGSYRIMRTQAVKEVRWRDEWNDSRSEEWRICGELVRMGYKCGYARYVRCYHLFGGENWGYDRGVPHYHVSRDFGEPTDVDFDPLSCKPRVEQYGHE